MIRLQRFVDRVLADEPVEPFDYEPDDQSLVEPDDPRNAPPDQGDNPQVTA